MNSISKIAAQDMFQSELDAENLVREIMENMTDNIYFKDLKCQFVLVNKSFCEWAKRSQEDVIGKTDFDIFSAGPHAQAAFDAEQEIIKSGLPLLGIEEEEVWPDGHVTWVSTSKMPWRNKDGEIIGTCGISRDITINKKLEGQLAQAQKLESVGQLAAGIAHEINTPIQFVSDNLCFLKDSVQELLTLADQYRQFIQFAKKSGFDPASIKEQETFLDDADMEYQTEELPKAIEQSLEGTDRVSKIVRAMKEFSHPGSSEMSDANLNEAIETTLIVTNNEWKFVATVETNFAKDLPSVPCLISELNQVVLNMIVNARDAIEETGEMGTITLSTTYDDHWVIARISDSGAGMPENIQSRIFDPFYTTKEVGKGSGQGLAIAHNVIVNKHGGELNVISKPSEGATFEIKLPRKQNPEGSAKAS
ncbi:ATP-binding protein [Pontiellaceae bacterium B1224]|nr:ATP-binding protein [Pontiellaceae bacterium B1224]